MGASRGATASRRIAAPMASRDFARPIGVCVPVVTLGLKAASTGGNRVIERAGSGASAAVRACFLAVTLVCACGGTPPSPPPDPGPGDRIEMSRGPCFGACPVYTVTVRADGRVRFEGLEFVKVTGVREARGAATDVAGLFALGDSIGFFDLPSDITPSNEAACGDAWTDMPDAEVTRDPHRRGGWRVDLDRQRGLT